MQVGIWGESFSGKSTLLRVLITELGHTFDESKAKKGIFVASIPDERVDYLAGVFNPKRKMYSTMTLLEIPPGSEGMVDARNIASIGACNLLLLVIPLFQSDVAGYEIHSVNAYEYYRNIETELCLADYMVTQKRVERLQKEGKKTRELQLLEKVASFLESSTSIRDVALREEEKKMLSGFSLLSDIPIIVVMNVDENGLGDKSVKSEVDKLRDHGVASLVICARLEEEIMSLEPEDREIFMKEVGMEEFVAKPIIEASYRLLNLITFLTVNPNEVRAWSIDKGSSAIEAAGKIHSDMERGFIRAEVISFDDFSQFNDMSRAKSAGKVGLEGKDYIVQDGDIFTVRFNV